ncbi:hypothetical protein [Streptomyces fradiae]|uniref:hypothetical protein n=1 Tax=Streptomyces fradiae TaxID=1906 RepID=UPI003986E665
MKGAESTLRFRTTDVPTASGSHHRLHSAVELLRRSCNIAQRDEQAFTPGVNGLVWQAACEGIDSVDRRVTTLADRMSEGPVRVSASMIACAADDPLKAEMVGFV